MCPQNDIVLILIIPISLSTVALRFNIIRMKVRPIGYIRRTSFGGFTEEDPGTYISSILRKSNVPKKITEWLVTRT